MVQWYENDVKWKKIFAEKHGKLEDKDELITYIKDEYLPEEASVLIPLLD